MTRLTVFVQTTEKHTDQTPPNWHGERCALFLSVIMFRALKIAYDAFDLPIAIA